MKTKTFFNLTLLVAQCSRPWEGRSGRRWRVMKTKTFFNLTLLVAQCSTNEELQEWCLPKKKKKKKELQEWFMISWAIWDARNRYATPASYNPLNNTKIS
jgi:hypothetical protein